MGGGGEGMGGEGLGVERGDVGAAGGGYEGGACMDARAVAICTLGEAESGGDAETGGSGASIMVL